jgi:DNA-binding NtrC family response regulator
MNQDYRGFTSAKRFHPETLAALTRYGWPGNVRELEHFVQREFLFCDGSELRASPMSASSTTRAPSEQPAFKQAKARAIADFERSYVASAMEHAHGNISQAARLAGQDRSAFSKLVRKYGICPQDTRESHPVE